LEAALDRVFEEFPLEVEGRRVLLKPNILGPYPPDRHVNTAPEVVRALVGRLRSMGADVTVGDNPGARGYGMVEKSAAVSGILDASIGAYSNISTDSVETTLPGKGIKLSVSREVLETEVLVSVPKFKTHVLTSITGAIKNSFGFVVGGQKTGLHRNLPDSRAFSEMLVDLYRVRVPDLVIMDGIVGMEGNGPSGTSLYPVGKVIASDDGVALDSVMAAMMGMEPGRVATLEYAATLGLGETDLSKIEVLGEARPLKKFKRPTSGIPQRMPHWVMETFYPHVDRPRFDVDTDRCTACGQCRDICPGNAITIEDRHPVYDYNSCLSCYCCMELCSEQAIDLHDSLLTRLYRRIGIL
jgi:uncharacterized protein (DUF362 family)/ferredoxin